MSTALSTLSVFFIPVIITIIIVYGLKKKAPVYDLFAEGAKDGISTAIEILPFIIAIFIGIEAITSSGAMEWLQTILGPVFEFFGIPEDLISLILLRPVSGSGSLVLAQRIMEDCGPDSLVGRAASVMVGSCETVFYVLALYFGVTAVKKMRHAFAAGLIGYIIGILASVFICNIM